MSQSIFDDNDVFKNMNPLKVQVMRELVEDVKGKSMRETAPLILAAMQKLKNKGLSFNAEETAVLMEVLTRDMSPGDKAKVQSMKNILKKNPARQGSFRQKRPK